MLCLLFGVMAFIAFIGGESMEPDPDSFSLDSSTSSPPEHEANIPSMYPMLCLLFGLNTLSSLKSISISISWTVCSDSFQISLSRCSLSGAISVETGVVIVRVLLTLTLFAFIEVPSGGKGEEIEVRVVDTKLLIEMDFVFCHKEVR